MLGFLAVVAGPPLRRVCPTCWEDLTISQWTWSRVVAALETSVTALCILCCQEATPTLYVIHLYTAWHQANGIAKLIHKRS